MMVGQGPMRRSTTLKNSSSAMRKMGEILMRRELSPTRIPSQLLLRSLKQMSKRALPLAVSHPLPRRPGQRTQGPQNRSPLLLPQNLPHLRLTGDLWGTGAPLGNTQTVGVLPVNLQPPKMRMRRGGSEGSSLPQRFPWQWSGPGGDEKRKSAACKRSAGQPVPRSSSDSMKSLGRLISGLKQSLQPHLLPLLPQLYHPQSPKNSLLLQLCRQRQPQHQRKNLKSQHKSLLCSPPPVQVWLQLPLW